ncbi:MAG: 30S ribosome-binding factor RbfA [Clostridium sp.]
MRKNSIKNTRINSEVQRELSEIVSRELKDPRINPMTTVVSAEVTADLKYCKVYVSVLGDEASGLDTIKGLKSAVGYIRTQLAKRINLRNTPELTFILDQSIEYGVHMTHLINEATASLHKDDVEDVDDNDGSDLDEQSVEEDN